MTVKQQSALAHEMDTYFADKLHLGLVNGNY